MRGEARAKNLELARELVENQLEIQADPTRLRQVLINLIGNAIKFTREGQVTVRLLAHGDRPNDPGRIEVTDTGIGIPLDLQEHIFEAFSQAESGTSRSFEGTGLGLAISRAICHELGYRLELESAEGRGATFSIVFP